MIPTWWPPSGYDPMTEDHVRELFRYHESVVPSVMADAHRRIQARVGDDPIQVYPTTVKDLAGRRLGYFSALKIVHLSARDLDETVSAAIGQEREEPAGRAAPEWTRRRASGACVRQRGGSGG